MKSSLYKRFNPMGSILLIAAAVFVFGLLALFIVFYSPECLGVRGESYRVGEAYEFNRFTFDGENISITIPEKGWLVPGYIRDSVYGVVVLGNGTYTIKGDSPDSGAFTSVFMPISPDGFKVLRDGLILQQRYSSAAISYAENIFAQSVKHSVFTLKIFNITRMYPPPANMLSGFINRHDGKIIPFSENLSLPGNSGRSGPSGFTRNVFTVLSLFIATTLLASAIYMLTVEHPHHVKNAYGAFVELLPGPGLTVSGLILFHLLMAWFAKGNVSDLLGRLCDTALAVVVLAFIFRKKQRYFNVYLNPSALVSGGFLGLGTALLALFLAALELPQHMLPITVEGLIFALVTAAGTEFVFRGIVQTYLCSRFSAIVGLFGTPVVLGLIHLVTSLHYANPTSASVIQSLVAVPLGAFIPGYLFYRTRSLVPGTVFSAVIGLVPPLLIF